MSFSHEASAWMLNFLQNKRKKAPAKNNNPHLHTYPHTEAAHFLPTCSFQAVHFKSLNLWKGLFTWGVSPRGARYSLRLGAWCCTSHWPLPGNFKLIYLGCPCIWGVDKSFPCLLHKDGADTRRTTWNPGNIDFATSRSYHRKQRGKVSSFHKFQITLFIFILSVLS